MKDWEQNNFPTILKKNTRENRKIILIIDESHWRNNKKSKRNKRRNNSTKPNNRNECNTSIQLRKHQRKSICRTNRRNKRRNDKKEIIINDKIAEAIEKEENEKVQNH